MPKGSIGGFSAGGSNAHNVREQLKNAKKADKLAAKRELSEARHKAHFISLQKWIEETRPFCMEIIKEMRTKKPTVREAVEVLAIAKWYEQRVAKELKSCGKNRISTELLSLLDARTRSIFLDVLMRAQDFRGNGAAINLAIEKEMIRFNSGMN